MAFPAPRVIALGGCCGCSSLVLVAGEAHLVATDLNRIRELVRLLVSR